MSCAAPEALIPQLKPFTPSDKPLHASMDGRCLLGENSEPGSAGHGRWLEADSSCLAETMAKNVCAAHAIATKAGSNIVWVAHNDMQVRFLGATG